MALGWGAGKALAGLSHRQPGSDPWHIAQGPQELYQEEFLQNQESPLHIALK